MVDHAPAAPIVLRAGSPFCIDDWFGGRAGEYEFRFVNDEAAGMEVYLQDAESERIYVEVEHFGRGATRTVRASIPPGRYRWACITDYSVRYSHPVTVTGEPLPYDVHGIVPLNGIDLRAPIGAYVAWLTGRLPVLYDQIDALHASIDSGDAAAAKRDWLTAHLTFETLGGAYGAYGPTGEAINGDPPRGVSAADAEFAGFRKIEAMLWSGRPLPAIAPHVGALREAMRSLAALLARPAAIAPIDMGRRVHEILEDALQKDLNGIGDAGSRTELATLDANLTGTWHALHPVRAILRAQDPYLEETEAQLSATQHLVRTYRADDEGWMPLAALTSRQRAGINAAVQQCVELLSHASVILDPRNVTR